MSLIGVAGLICTAFLLTAASEETPVDTIVTSAFNTSDYTTVDPLTTLEAQWTAIIIPHHRQENYGTQ